MTRLLLICGSLRSGSTNEALLRTVASLLPSDVEADQSAEINRMRALRATMGKGADAE